MVKEKGIVFRRRNGRKAEESAGIKKGGCEIKRSIEEGDRGALSSRIGLH